MLMRGDGTDRDPPGAVPDGALWRNSRVTDAADNEAERFLDLAGFADGRLDPDDRERVAGWLAGDPVAAGDVAAARALVAAVEQVGAAPETIVARACALAASGAVLLFLPRRQPRMRLDGLARWGSLVAAVVIASWLGFTLGMDTSQSFGQVGRAGEDGVLHELLDPSSGFMPDLTGSAQT